MTICKVRSQLLVEGKMMTVIRSIVGGCLCQTAQVIVVLILCSDRVQQDDRLVSRMPIHWSVHHKINRNLRRNPFLLSDIARCVNQRIFVVLVNNCAQSYVEKSRLQRERNDKGRSVETVGAFSVDINA